MSLFRNVVAKIFLFALALASFNSIAELGSPKVMNKNGIDYISGGIGEEEQKMIKSVASDFKLQITFASKDGSYLSGVKVSILDANANNIIETGPTGPLFRANLGSGNYVVKVQPVEFSGDSQTHNITITEATVTLNITW